MVSTFEGEKAALRENRRKRKKKKVGR